MFSQNRMKFLETRIFGKTTFLDDVITKSAVGEVDVKKLGVAFKVNILPTAALRFARKFVSKQN